MDPIDKSEYEKRLARISDILGKMVTHADKQSKLRCPYKDRLNQCTAKFLCGYQRQSKGELPICASDDSLDYRSAWEVDPDAFEKMRETLSQGSKTSSGSVSHEGQSCPAAANKTLFDHADELGVKVPTSCGRMGTCHECIVEVRRGMDALSRRSEEESFLTENYRLACQAVVERPESEIEFGLLRRAPQILTEQTRRAVALDPLVNRRGDRVYYGDKEIDSYRGNLYGIALDVGTTTVVLELLDLESGQSVYSSSFENPQRFGGSDIMNRISYDAGEFQGELHRAIINTLNTEVRAMCSELDISRHEIYEILVVGNATMRELFFDMDVQSIGQRPYKSLVETEYLEGKRDSTSLSVSARQLRIMANKNAQVYGAPIIASHVGGDVTADLVTIDIASCNDVVMLADCGTNTEVVIGNKDRLIVASCPAGPAFEGGLVKFGMPGCEGAIESIRYVDSRFNYKTIGDVPPEGICGSGLIDLLAELRRHDLMTPLGVFADGTMELAIVPERGITLSRRDASELAQAKAANYCGQLIVMRNFGVTPEDISKLYLAGGFANYVDPSSAVDIGFVAPVPPDRIEKVGNAAAQGAREMLLSVKKRVAIEGLVKSIEHVELETTPDFFEVFVEGCQFKPMDL